jgi:hypothetical protein
MATAGIPTTGLAPTASLKKDQRAAMEAGRSMTADANHTSETVLKTQDEGPQTAQPIYIYNICEFSHVRNQPPEFPAFTVEPCAKGQKFSVKPFPAYVNERYARPGEAEYYYRKVDGRKYATSLLNPDTYPGTDWQAQLIEGTTGNNDMTGMNMNALGVFWSELAPTDARLESVLKLFRTRVDKTMDALVKEGNRWSAEGKLGNISPMMHSAMDYFGLSGPWHMSLRHKTECPNCGDLVLEGIAYHRNASGDICIIDRERYEASVITTRQQKETETVPMQTAERKPRTKAVR